MMKHSAGIKARFADASKAKAALEALKAEEGSKARVRSKVEAHGEEVSVSVEADDVVALRATLNSYLRYLQIFEGVKEKNENGG